LYANNHTGAAEYPWILGGRDISTPDRKALEAYQAHGYLLDFTLADLKALYDVEGILVGSGMENEPGVPRNPSFRHVLEGGKGLFTPYPYSIGYKRLMCREHPTYQPQTESVKALAASIQLNQQTLASANGQEKQK
jgi:hypothetical protein